MCPINRIGTIPNLSQFESEFNNSIEQAFREIGRQAVEWAINHHLYQNRTTNLEDSYGFAVYYMGEMVGEPEIRTPAAVKGVKDYLDGEIKTGHDETVRLLNEYEAYPAGWSLVVMAGMFYASFPNLERFDVLESAELHAEQVAETLLRNITWTKIK